MRKLFVSCFAVLAFAALAVAAEKTDWAQDLFGDKLIKRDKTAVKVDELKGKKKVAIYFSAHWCPPCRAFTPKLVEAYDKAKKDGAEVELLFVSSDQSEEAMFKYMNETKMDWLAVPYDGPRREIGSKYGVRGIPTLVILDGDGKIITKNGRGEVMSKGADAFK